MYDAPSMPKPHEHTELTPQQKHAEWAQVHEKWESRTRRHLSPASFGKRILAVREERIRGPSRSTSRPPPPAEYAFLRSRVDAIHRRLNLASGIAMHHPRKRSLPIMGPLPPTHSLRIHHPPT